MNKLVVGIAHNISDASGKFSSYYLKRETGIKLLDFLKSVDCQGLFSSISHTDDYSAVAISDFTIGIDMEPIAEVLPETDSYIRLFLKKKFPFAHVVGNALLVKWTSYEAWYKSGCIRDPIFLSYNVGNLLLTICMSSNSESNIVWKFFDFSDIIPIECLSDEIGLQNAFLAKSDFI